MNKIILTALFIFIIANPVFAKEVAKRVTYSDGTIVLLCDIKGKIDYCTEQDRQKAAELDKNPNVSIVEEVMIKHRDDDEFNEKCQKTQGNVLAGTNLLYSVIDLARVIKGLFGVKW